jgi:predicted enzyme related to lactoylglutathione lyase
MKLANVTFDANDPARLAAFWAAATGREEEFSNEFIVILGSGAEDAKMLFIKVPEEKTAKNRCHVDFHAEDREAEVARLVGLGATRHDTHTQADITWTVMTDPEGNEFCIAG